MNKQGLIRKLKDLEVVEQGDFELKSGKQSDIYFDIKKAFGDPDILRELSERLCQMGGENVDSVAAAGYGGLPLASVMAEECDLKLVLVRDDKKEYGREEQIAGFVPNEDSKVMIVDDVVTTGTNLRNIREILSRTGCKIAGQYVVLDRSEESLDLKVNSILKAEDLTPSK